MKRTMAILGLLTLLLAMIPPAGAQDLSGIPAAYVDIGLGVRPLGMGGAFVAVADDENGARWNPAALAVQKTMAFGFTWTKQMNIVPYNYLNGAVPVADGIGTGYYFQTSGDEVLRENTGAVGVGVKLERWGIPNLYAGMTAKLRWASYGDNADGGIAPGDPTGQVTGSAFGYGVDLGLYWDWPRINGLTAAVVIRDLLNTITWDREVAGTSLSGSYGEGVPTTMAVGVAYRYGDHGLLALDIQPSLYSDVYWRYAFGAEYVLLQVIALRAGYSQDMAASEVNRDWTVGLGIDVGMGKVHVDAGISYLFDELANTPRVGLALRW